MEHNFLNDTVYPALFDRMGEVFPEFGFKSIDGEKGRIWVSTTTTRPDGHTGSNKGKTYVTEAAPYYLADHAGHGCTVWDYVTSRDGCPDNSATFARLCELAAVEKKGSPEQARAAAAAARRTAVMEAINAYLINQLHTTEAAAAAREYIDRRGGILRAMLRYNTDQKAVNDIGQERAELGFLPGVPALLAYLKEKFGDIEPPPLPPITAGGRLSITLRERGKIVGFKFRVLHDRKCDDKYLNSKGYEKTAHLIGLRPTKNPGGVVLVEGELGAMAAHGAGFLEVATTGGASLSDTQIKKAIDAGGGITLAYDNDEPGRKGTESAIAAILQYQHKNGVEFPVFVCQYPAGVKGFDDVLNMENGREQAAAMLAARVSLGRYYYRWLTNEGAEAITERTGTDYTSDLFRAELMKEAAAIEIKLPPVEIPLFRQCMAGTFEAYGIDPAGMEAQADAIRDAMAARRYEKELQSIADQAKEAAAKGDISEAERLLWHETREARAKQHAGRFASLLEGHTLADVAQGLSVAALQTSFEMRGKNGVFPLELPAAAISVFAGASGHGKTAVLINLMLDLCERYPRKEFHFFSLEESREVVTAKMLNTFADMDVASSNEPAINAYLKGEQADGMTTTTRGDLATKASEFFNLFGARIWVHYLETATVEEFTEAVRWLHKRRQVGAIFADYLQLFGLDNPGRLDRVQETKRICGTLKNCAIDTGLPLVFAAQFNRITSEEESRKYTNIGEAGDIERVAALIVGLWNREYNDEIQEDETPGTGNRKGRPKAAGPSAVMAAKILKWRGGPVGATAAWGWNGNRKRIYNNAAAPAKLTTNKNLPQWTI